MESVSKKV